MFETVWSASDSLFYCKSVSVSTFLDCCSQPVSQSASQRVWSQMCLMQLNVQMFNVQRGFYDEDAEPAITYCRSTLNKQTKKKQECKRSSSEVSHLWECPTAAAPLWSHWRLLSEPGTSSLCFLVWAEGRLHTLDLSKTANSVKSLDWTIPILLLLFRIEASNQKEPLVDVLHPHVPENDNTAQ